MSDALSVEPILGQAGKKEKEHDWWGAVESYKEALALVSEKDSTKMGEISERLGYAFYRAAFQGESTDEFRESTRQAIVNYEKARVLSIIE
jgi:hypothetical protein